MRQVSLQDNDFKGQGAKMASWEWYHSDVEPKMCLRPHLSFCDTLTLKPVCCLISVSASADIRGDSCFYSSKLCFDGALLN